MPVLTSAGITVRDGFNRHPCACTKIGKANDANKRGAGISPLLPEDLVPKHEIRTDCPFILEKYWENRFRSKKKQASGMT